MSFRPADIGRDSLAALARLVVVCAGFGTVVYFLRWMLLPFVFGGALAYCGLPLLRRFERGLGAPRWMAASLTFVSLVALLGVFGYWLVRELGAEISRGPHDLPKMLQQAFETLAGKGDHRLLGRAINAKDLAEELTRSIETYTSEHAELAPIMAKAFTAGMGFFLSLLLCFYFLLSGRRLVNGLLWLVPAPHRGAVSLLGIEIERILGRYVRGVIIVIVITTAAAWVGLRLILHLPHALVLSLIVGILEFVPIAGPLAAIGLVSMVAIGEGTAWAIVGVAIFFLVIRVGIDQLIGPIVLGRSVALHPVVVLFAMLAGMAFFGVLGVLLAVPVAAIAKLALQRRYRE